MKLCARVLSLALALALLLCACAAPGNSHAPVSSANQTPVPTPVAGASSPGVPSSDFPIPGNKTLTMLRVLAAEAAQGGFPNYAQSPNFKAWQEQTGVTVELREPADNAALLLALSSGDVPDIIVGQKNFYPGGITKLAEDGFAVDLSDKLPVWAPDYWALLQSDQQFMTSVMTNKKYHYGMGGYLMPVDSEFRTWRGFLARKEYLDALKMDVPETMDEFYGFLVGVRDTLEKPYPFCVRNNMINDMLADGRLTSAYGLVSADQFQIDGKVHLGAYEPAYKDVLAYLNRLYNEKLLDNNFPSNTDDIVRAAMMSGEAAVTSGATSWVAALTSGATEQPYNLVGIGSLVANKGDEPMFGHADPVVTIYSWSFFPEECKDLETAIRFVNYLQAPGGRILSNYGIEGKTFEYVNGKPTLTDFVNKNPDGYTRDQLMRVYGMLNWGCLHLREMSVQRYPLQAQRDAISAWFVPGRDKYVLVNDTIDPQYIKEYTQLWTDIYTYIGESRVKFITGETPLTEFDKYLSTLKTMGMDRVLEIKQISYDMNN